MFKQPETAFIDLLLAGDALLEEVDDYVELWHESGGEETLAAFLGMTDEEYALWAPSPDALAQIVRARHQRIPLSEVVNDNYSELRAAARGGEARKARQLSVWLRSMGHLD
jgi:hypothetical protein